MKHNTRCEARRDQGMSLVAVLVGVALLGIMAIVMSQFMSNLYASSKLLQEKSELEDLRQNVRARLSCFNTVAAMSSTCSSGTAIKTYDLGDQVAFTTPYQKVGVYYVRAICTGAAFQFDYEYAKKTSGPWANLFPKVPVKCY